VAPTPTRASSVPTLFGFAQFEYGFLLGPGDGRFVVRERPDRDPDAVLILSTLGARQRRPLRRRKGQTIQVGSPAPVPTNRATVVKAEPFADAAAATAWLAVLRTDASARESELSEALRVLNRALHAHRVSKGDGHARDVSVAQALVTRLGFGSGEEAVEGRYAEAWELAVDEGPRVKRSMEAPDERFAAVIGARETVLACEELVLRARVDLDAGRAREAALQARVALEALLAEVDDLASDRRGALDADRVAIGSAANAALGGELPAEAELALRESVGRMESALKSRRLSTSSRG
jgi:hypothetical protein